MSQAITDETLTAFLDGALPEDEAQAIAAAVDTDPDLAARIEALEFDADALRAGMAALLDEAPDMPPLADAAQAEDQSPWPRRVAGLAALAATLVVGVVLGGALQPGPTAPDWRVYVASYQALYVTETLPGAAPDTATRNAQLARAGDRLDLDLQRLPDVDGLDFRRAQVLGYENQPLIQIAFLGPEGRPVALCIIAHAGGAADVTQDRAEGMEAAAWSDDTHAYYLIGGDDPDLIRMAADIFRASL